MEDRVRNEKELKYVIKDALEQKHNIWDLDFEFKNLDGYLLNHSSFREKVLRKLVQFYENYMSADYEFIDKYFKSLSFPKG